MQTTESRELSETEQLYRISEATNEDGTVSVELHDFKKDETDGNRVKVEFITPDGDIHSEYMDWPQTDTDEYTFVRVFDETGYGVIGAEEACAANVTVSAKCIDGSWELRPPENMSLSEKIWSRIPRPTTENADEVTVYMILFTPLITFAAMFEYFALPDVNGRGTGYAEAGMGWGLWVTILTLVILIV